jgi:predicted transcriptional regulator
MTNPRSASAVVDVLAQRYEMLAALADDPATQAELGERIEVSRPTAHRAIKTFEDLGMVHKRDGKYALTEFGREVASRHGTYLEDLDRLCQLSAVRRDIPDDISLGSPVLEGADVFFNDSYALDSASYENKEDIENSVRVCSVIGSLTSQFFEVHRGDVPHREVTWIIPDDHVETIKSTYRKLVRELLESDFFELYRTPEPVSYTTTVAETLDCSYAILLTHSDGRVTSNVRNDSPDAVAWAKERFKRYMESAERIGIQQFQ